MFIFPFDSARITPLGSYAECVLSRIMPSKRAFRKRTYRTQGNVVAPGLHWNSLVSRATFSNCWLLP
jgi:hypothetical protein